MATTDLFIVSIVLLFLEDHIVGIIQFVAFLDWILIACIYRSFISFHGLRTHLFLALNSIPLSGCATVYLSIYPLKDILVASKFLVTMNKTSIINHVQVFDGH